MDVQFFDLVARRIAHEALLHAQDDLGDNLQFAIHEHIEGVGDDAFGGVFHGHNAVIRAAFADFGKNIGNGLLRSIFQAGAEAADGCLMGESGFRTEIGDVHGLLQREGAGHDLAIDGLKLFAGDRAGIEAGDAVQYGALAMRRINFLAGLALDRANGEHVACAFVQKAHELLVQCINGLTMYWNAQRSKDEEL